MTIVSGVIGAKNPPPKGSNFVTKANSIGLELNSEGGGWGGEETFLQIQPLGPWSSAIGFERNEIRTLVRALKDA